MPDEIPCKFQDALDSAFPTSANALHQHAFENSDDGVVLDACTWHRVAGAVEFKNTYDNSCTPR